MPGTVIVVGSINVDYTIGVPSIPRPGETVLGDDARMAWGGKGANQAVAAAAAGADVWMVGAVGDDHLGHEAVAALAAAGVRTDFVDRVARPTGLASIVVDPAGENAIAVAPGANGAVSVPSAAALTDIGDRAVLLVSLEIGDDAVLRAVQLATDRRWPIVVNPAPATALPAALLEAAPILIPNEHEATALSDEPDPTEAGRLLHQRTRAPVVVTVGAGGALVIDDHGLRHFDAPLVDPVDTTGAGDAFCGAFAAAIGDERPLGEAVEAGISAGSRAVTHPGARC